MKRHLSPALLAALLPLLARAQDAGVAADSTDVSAGVALTWTARYPGADGGRLLPAPVLAVQRGFLFADTARGIGPQYQSPSGFYTAQSISYDPGRLDRDSRWRPGSSRLAGMGDVPATVTARTLVAQQVTPWLLASAEGEFALRDAARRNRYRVGVEFAAFKTATDSVTVDVDAWWGDGRYNRAWFGVTPQQAAHTGFAAFRPAAGLYARTAGIAWEHRLDGHWSTTVQLTETRYAGQADASPIVARHAAAGATVVLSRTY